MSDRTHLFLVLMLSLLMPYLRLYLHDQFTRETNIVAKLLKFQGKHDAVQMRDVIANILILLIFLPIFHYIQLLYPPFKQFTIFLSKRWCLLRYSMLSSPLSSLGMSFNTNYYCYFIKQCSCRPFNKGLFMMMNLKITSVDNERKPSLRLQQHPQVQRLKKIQIIRYIWTEKQ